VIDNEFNHDMEKGEKITIVFKSEIMGL